MPRPPAGIHIFDQLKFVTNFMLAGCGPEKDLIFEMNGDAANQLLLLLVTFDMSDIVQSFFDPKKGRKRKPGRHGRKRPIISGIPDINEEIGKRYRVREMNVIIQKLPLGRFVLPAINIEEGISIFAMVVEGVGDVVFDNVAGLLDLNPQYCREFERFRRQLTNKLIVGFPGPLHDPIFFNKPIGNVGFIQTDTSARNIFTNWGCSVSILITNHADSDYSQGRLSLRTLEGELLDRTPMITLNHGDYKNLTVSGTVPKNHTAAWYWEPEHHYAEILNGTVVGYGQSGWLDWTEDLF